MTMQITAQLGRRRVSREDVLAWEDRRIAAAARKLRVPEPTGATLPHRREALLEAKLELGQQEIRRRLARDVRLSAGVARATGKVSAARRTSITELEVRGGDAAAFVEWFEAAALDPDQRAMLQANPDHFVIAPGPHGQEVLETTGGSPLATSFTVDYDDVSSLRTPADPAFEHQIAGVARGSDGRPIGGVRHQFRPMLDGFVARLTVEFPLLTLPTMVAAHRTHLACEFSNWIEAAQR